MSTKSSSTAIQPGFEDLFAFSSEEDKLDHRAQMISYRVLSEVETICEEKGINKKELAEMVNTSASYITQLFRGDKHVNTSIMAKFEEALEMRFEIKLTKTVKKKEKGKAKAPVVKVRTISDGVNGRKHLHKRYGVR